ncbi:tyrosine-type recombinase/integrase [Anaerovibrio lipolyticus]|uniref:tyrosine-type recombinase/integrase n=1 Tax=Anaerovibrio lipolyticus TaxID=82374 RepID=UPI0023F57757|nr:tyrosine-type recombinase/integrase [Anaerovibrio lipolyticus]
MGSQKKARAHNEGTVFYREDRKRWVAQVTAGVDPKTGKIRRPLKYFKTQKEALAYVRQMLEKYSHNLHVDADKMTVRDWLNKWFDTYKVPKLRENTQVSYRGILDICINAIGNMKLDKVQTSDLQYVIYKVIGTNKYRTCQYFRTVIKQAFKRARQEHLIVDNPAEFLELPQKPAKKPFVKPTIEDWKTLLEYPTGFYGWQMAIYTEYITGLRRSELLALTWDSFDIKRDENGKITGGSVIIDKAIAIGNKDPETKRRRVYIDKTKSEKSVRKLKLSADYCLKLMEYKKKQAAIRLASKTWEHPEMVFTTNDGRYYNPDVFSSLYSRICREKDLKFRFHDLRHDMATSMKLSHIFDVKDIQGQLGHSNVQITLDTYTHIEDEDASRVGDWVDERFKKLIQ